MNFLFVFLLGALSAKITPPSATVGDLVTIEVQGAPPNSTVKLDPSAAFEVVSSEGPRVVIRSFRPGTMTISGVLERDGTPTRFSGVEVSIGSVLKANDALDPAPLRPPRPLPSDRRPWYWIAGAAVAAALAWGALVYLLRRGTETQSEESTIAAAEEFRIAIKRIRASEATEANLVRLADATRRYLARTSRGFGRDLTTREIVGRLRRSEPGSALIVDEILRAADLAKFAPWGAPAIDARALAVNALELIPPDPVEEVKAA